MVPAGDKGISEGLPSAGTCSWSGYTHAYWGIQAIFGESAFCHKPPARAFLHQLSRLSKRKALRFQHAVHQPGWVSLQDFNIIVLSYYDSEILIRLWAEHPQGCEYRVSRWCTACWKRKAFLLESLSRVISLEISPRKIKYAWFERKKFSNLPLMWAHLPV